MSRNQINFLETKNNNKSLNKAVFSFFKKNLLFIIIIVIGLSFGIIYSKFYPQKQKVNYNPVTLKAQKPENFFKKVSGFFTDENDLTKKYNDRLNILLLGIGGPGHDGPYLTDTIMILSLKFSTKQVALISIPRDLAVYIPHYGLQKINHLNAVGELNKKNFGPAYTANYISKLFNIEIPFYIRVDFQAFTDIINEVGGLEINVEKSFVDNAYPAPNNEYQTISFKTGLQTMDAEKVLQYARSRHGNNGEGSDFARARRQQQIILALKNKFLSLNLLMQPNKIKNIYKTLDNHILTNLQFSEIIGLAKIISDFDYQNIIHLVLDDTPNGYLVAKTGSNFLLFPKNNDFTEINSIIQNIFDPQIVKTIQEKTKLTKQYLEALNKLEEQQRNQQQKTLGTLIEIQNGTWQPGLAGQTKQNLEESLQIFINKIGNTQPELKPVAKSQIIVINKTDDNLKLAKKIADFLDVPIIDNPNISDLNYDENSAIVIILGKDFKNIQ